MPATEVVAVCQCSGNRRGLFEPHVVGVEWGYGAMGCARFKGVRLKDVLDRVGLKKEAIELVLDGADGQVFDGRVHSAYCPAEATVAVALPLVRVADVAEASVPLTGGSRTWYGPGSQCLD